MRIDVLSIWTGYIEALVLSEEERILAIFTLIHAWSKATLALLMTVKAQLQRLIKIIIINAATTLNIRSTVRTTSWAIITSILP
jgi:hypothetical protein